MRSPSRREAGPSRRVGPSRAEAGGLRQRRAAAGQAAPPVRMQGRPRRSAPHRGKSFAWLRSLGERGRNELPAALSGIRAVPPSRPHLSLSTEANTVFGDAIFVEADALVDGLVRRQMLIFVLKAPVEPAGDRKSGV